jgi:hypothetical protein
MKRANGSTARPSEFHSSKGAVQGPTGRNVKSNKNHHSTMVRLEIRKARRVKYTILVA